MASSASAPTVQQVYELCFCLWTLTLDATEATLRHFALDGAVAALSDLMAAAPREKVLRVAVASLRRLAESAPALLVPEMIACRVLQSAELLKGQRQWSDPDILEGKFCLVFFVYNDSAIDDSSYDVTVGLLPPLRFGCVGWHFASEFSRFDQVGSISSRVGFRSVEMGNLALGTIHEIQCPPHGRR